VAACAISSAAPPLPSCSTLRLPFISSVLDADTSLASSLLPAAPLSCAAAQRRWQALPPFPTSPAHTFTFFTRAYLFCWTLLTLRADTPAFPHMLAGRLNVVGQLVAWHAAGGAAATHVTTCGGCTPGWRQGACHEPWAI